MNQESGCEVCGKSLVECRKSRLQVPWQETRHAMWEERAQRTAAVTAAVRARFSHMEAAIQEDLVRSLKEADITGFNAAPPRSAARGRAMTQAQKALEAGLFFDLLPLADAKLAERGCLHGMAAHLLGGNIQAPDLFGFQRFLPDRGETSQDLEQ